MSEVTRVLGAIENGDPHAAEKLLPLVYDELRKLAAQRLAQEKPGQTLQATALVHEAYLRLVDGEHAQHWNGRGHFFAAAAQAMRQILVENARRKRRLKRGGDAAREELDESTLVAPAEPEDLVALDEVPFASWPSSMHGPPNWSTCAISPDSRSPRPPRSSASRPVPRTSFGPMLAPGFSRRSRGTPTPTDKNRETPLRDRSAKSALLGRGLPWSPPTMNERDVFIAALQIESRAQRQAYLDEACGSDEELRLQVAALLATHERAGNFLQEPLMSPLGAAAALLDQPAGAPLGEGASAPTSPAGEQTPKTPVDRDGLGPPSLGFLAPPQQPDEAGRLGHYRVLRLLGQGGMGMVFLADDTELQRPVALKVMRAELAANPEGRQAASLFEKAARAAAQVRSDHVVNVHHVDQEGDLPYLVMELLLHGQSLAEAAGARGASCLSACA